MITSQVAGERDARVDRDEVHHRAELMARYCDGELTAFSALFAELAPRLLGYLVGMVGDRAAAEDLLQQTFIKLHHSRSTYVRGANPTPWIYAIAHRTCLDENRRRKRARVRISRDGDLDGRIIAEAAAPAGSSIGAIRQRVYRGYLALRSALGHSDISSDERQET